MGLESRRAPWVYVDLNGPLSCVSHVGPEEDQGVVGLGLSHHGALRHGTAAVHSRSILRAD